MSVYKYGDFYIDKLDNKTYYYNGTKWEEWLLGGFPPGGKISNPPTGLLAIVSGATAPAAGAAAPAAATAAEALTIGPVSGTTSSDKGTLRYPKDIKYSTSDYIFFQFGKYIPPFGSGYQTGDSGGLNAYNKSATDFKASGSSIILPMPQDLGSEMRHDWEGKSFTRVGAAAIAALGAGNLSGLGNTAKDFSGNIDAILDALKTAGLNKIPGIGGNISMNDISGSTRGVVLNPNAEVLYSNPNLREIGFTFKLVPYNEEESNIIYQICQRFRSAASPSYGGADDYNFGGENETNKTLKGKDNFIKVPNLCKFTFMKGNTAHPYLIQYKPCAITRVQVNFTPDGTYATYDNGAPVAVELQVGFLETKLVYDTEIQLAVNKGTF